MLKRKQENVGLSAAMYKYMRRIQVELQVLLLIFFLHLKMEEKLLISGSTPQAELKAFKS